MVEGKGSYDLKGATISAGLSPREPYPGRRRQLAVVAFTLTGVATVFFYARLWRRSGVLEHYPRVRLSAQMDGGGHEHGMRPGTLNVPGIVGLGEACAICEREMHQENARLADLRSRLLARLAAGLDGITVNGSLEHRLPHNLNVSFAGVESEALMMGMPGVAVSSGSACTSATMEPSYVLKAMGLSDDLARGALRFGIGRFNTGQDVDYAAHCAIEAVTRLRELSPLYEVAQGGL